MQSLIPVIIIFLAIALPCMVLKPMMFTGLIKGFPIGAAIGVASYLFFESILYGGITFLVIDVIMGFLFYTKKTQENKQHENIKKHNENLEKDILAALTVIRNNIDLITESDLPLLEHEKMLMSRINSIYNACEEAVEERDPTFDFGGNINYMNRNLNAIYNTAVQRYEEYYKKKYEEYNEYVNQREMTQKKASASYFAGCKTTESIKKRYKALCKVYHPDNGNGDAESFALIQSEYEALLRKAGG